MVHRISTVQSIILKKKTIKINEIFDIVDLDTSMHAQFN